ncbi:MAG: succinylglutamate desuccinylase/aspartoacylase family protein [Blautia sp.]|nr:succinylglutamate desuccinylase/aspartoacylase family protein [Blautia sp.]
MWKICGYEIPEGSSRQVTIEPGVEGYRIPATIVNGSRRGKTVLITASIHSGEYPGVPAVIRIAKEIDPEKVSGRILFIHCVNVSGFWSRTGGRVPEDNGNLNADYPGKQGGTVTECIADYFVREIFPQLDFVLDLHSGGVAEPLTPCLFYPKAPKVTAESLEAAKATTIPFLIESSATTGEFSYAANFFDVPGILLERGHSDLCYEEWIQADMTDIRLLLDHLGVYVFPEKEKVMQDVSHTISTDTVYLVSDEQALWYACIEAGDEVKKGQVLGYMEDFYGNPLKTFFAEDDGIVFYYTRGLAVRKGFPLVAYGLKRGMKTD